MSKRLDPCPEPHCGGSLLSDRDRRLCLLCGRVVRDHVLAIDPIRNAYAGNDGRSSKRYATESMTDGLVEPA